MCRSIHGHLLALLGVVSQYGPRLIEEGQRNADAQQRLPRCPGQHRCGHNILSAAAIDHERATDRIKCIVLPWHANNCCGSLDRNHDGQWRETLQSQMQPLNASRRVSVIDSLWTLFPRVPRRVHAHTYLGHSLGHSRHLRL